MSRQGFNPHNGERLFSEYEKKGANETRAVEEWKRMLDACDGDGFKAARRFKNEQPALFRMLEESGKSFEDLCELAAVMSGSGPTGPREWF